MKNEGIKERKPEIKERRREALRRRERLIFFELSDCAALVGSSPGAMKVKQNGKIRFDLLSNLIFPFLLQP